MQPGEIKRELEQLAIDATAVKDRLAALGAKIAAAIELVVTVRSSVRGVEGTPPSEPAQEPAQP